MKSVQLPNRPISRRTPRFRLAMMVLITAICALMTGTRDLRAADLDLYISLPKKMPPGNWKTYLGEIGSDTIATYKIGEEGKPQSSVSILWFHELYSSRAMLEKTAPALKKVLVETIHKGDTLVSEKMPDKVPVFGLKGDEKDSLVIYYEFDHKKTTEDREAGIYRYYYIFKPIDDKQFISIGVEVQIHNPAHTDAINSLLLFCGIRTPEEVAAAAAAAEAAGKPAIKPAAPAPTPANPNVPTTPGQPAPAKPPETPAPAPKAN